MMLSFVEKMRNFESRCEGKSGRMQHQRVVNKVKRVPRRFAGDIRWESRNKSTSIPPPRVGYLAIGTEASRANYRGFTAFAGR